MMKRVLTIMLCSGLMMAVLVSMTACGMPVKGAASSGKETASAQIPNPLVCHKTIDEASKVVGFTMMTPAKLPEGYVQNEIVTINKEIAQVNYMKGEDRITYRIAKGSADISGDYHEYPSTRTIAVGDISVTAKGANQNIHVACWTKDDFTYSIVFSVDVSDDELADIIEGI